MQNLPYDAVIFDMDGTLTRSEDGILASLCYTLDKMNVPPLPFDELKRFIGPPLRESFRCLADFSKEQADEAVQHYVSHFDRVGLFLYSIFPTIRPLLTALKKNNVYVAVATSKPISRTVRLLKHYHMDRYFDCVIGEQSNDAQIGKAGLIRRALPEQYRRAVMVGDRKFDIEGAKANGIDSIGVRYGYGLEGELEAAGATRIVDSVEELFSLLCPGCAIPRGFFLTVEGMDGSGKTTQINRLYASLTRLGYDVLQTREPGGCKISEKIRNLVLTTEFMEMSDPCEALLYAAARAQHVHEVIRPMVKAGKLVLCDRFVDSSIAYQGGGRELGVKEVGDINAFAIREMIPDATIYLRMDSMQAMNRRRSASKPDRLESQPDAFYERTREAYDQLMNDYPQRYITVDGAKPIDELAEDILRAVLPRLMDAEGLQMERIVVGMSGGVDSAVSALLLKQQGYDVVGVFMKNWDEKDANGVCTATADWEDVQDVCQKIGIPFYAVNFEKEYMDRVFSHFLSEYRKGRTPNPDVLCNREIKFKSLLEFAMKLGAEKLATGHFARTEVRDGHSVLLRGADRQKDQSYFLYMLKEQQLQKAVFPVGAMTKAQVRAVAKEHGLSVSGKKDSTGICFIGERNFRAFLKNYLPSMPGDMKTEAGETVGRHIGFAYYTPGQRKGLGIGGRGDGRSWFVLDKDLANNVLVVGQGEDHPRLFSKRAEAGGLTWIAGTAPMPAGKPYRCTAKFRYRQADQQVSIVREGDILFIEADEPQRAVTPGQSAVFYQGDRCLGGAIIETVHPL